MENELSARTQDTGRLRDPSIWVSPQARAVLGDREVEARIGIRDPLGIAVDQSKLESVLALEPARRRKLGGRVVDPDHARPAAGEPRRDVGRAASQLNRVLASEIIR